MAKSSLIVTTEDHITGNTQQKTITDINPQANDAHLKTWGQMVAGLSKDSYVKSDRVDKRNLDTDSKTGRELTLKIQNAQTSTVSNVPLDLSQDTFDIPLSYIQASSTSTAMSLGTPTDDTSRLFLSNLTGASLQWNQITYSTSYTGYAWRFNYEQITEPFTVSFKLALSANSLYNAWEKSITINFVNGGEG